MPRLKLQPVRQVKKNGTGCTFVYLLIAKKHIQNHGDLKNSTCPIHGTCLFAYVSRLEAN